VNINQVLRYKKQVESQKVKEVKLVNIDRVEEKDIEKY